mgnify:CR=1 FL=1
MWKTDSNPVKSDWYICIILSGNIRSSLRYNQPNNFWADFSGKTYKPVEIKWLDDSLI